MEGELAGRTAVLLDRHPVWLTGLERLVEGLGVDVVATTAAQGAMLEVVERVRPDLLVVELEAVGAVEDGFAGIQEAFHRHSELVVVATSSSSDDAYLAAAFAAGVSAVVLQTARPHAVAHAIAQAFERSVFLRAAYAGVKAHAQDGPTPAGAAADLTRRELEILQLAAEGHSNAQLARLLWVTEQTVKFHLSNVYRKLNVSNRTEAARWAQMNGLLIERRELQRPVAAA